MLIITTPGGFLQLFCPFLHLCPFLAFYQKDTCAFQNYLISMYNNDKGTRQKNKKKLWKIPHLGGGSGQGHFPHFYFKKKKIKMHFKPF